MSRVTPKSSVRLLNVEGKSYRVSFKGDKITHIEGYRRKPGDRSTWFWGTWFRRWPLGGRGHETPISKVVRAKLAEQPLAPADAQ